MDPISQLKSIDLGNGPAVEKLGANVLPMSKSANSSASVVKAVDGNDAVSNGAQDVRADSSAETVKQLKENVDTANARLASVNQRVDLSVDQDTGQVVVKVSNTSTGEVVSQIPSENSLKLAKSLDSLTGILVDKKS